jgi:voltage-gated potassium channel
MKFQKSIARATDTFKELTVIYASIIVLSSIAFSFVEKKSLWDSIWWSCVTAMTVGYGDIYPVTFFGRLIGIILMHVVPLVVVPLVVARFLQNVIEDNNQFTHEEQEDMKSLLRSIKSSLDAAK